MAFDINEMTSAQVQTTIEDLDGNALASIDFLLATLYLNDPITIVNSRVAQDIKGANEGTFTAGAVTLDLSPRRLSGRTRCTSNGDTTQQPIVL